MAQDNDGDENVVDNDDDMNIDDVYVDVDDDDDMNVDDEDDDDGHLPMRRVGTMWLRTKMMMMMMMMLIFDVTFTITFEKNGGQSAPLSYTISRGG